MAGIESVVILVTDLEGSTALANSVSPEIPHKAWIH